MLKILISEDNLYKLKNIQDTIEKQFNETNITSITYAKRTVMELIENNDYDILIQDMQLPLHSDDRIDQNGGIYVLNQLKRKKIDIKTIVCSSTIDSLEKLQNNGFENVSFIKYDSISINWENDLTKLINEYLKGK